MNADTILGVVLLGGTGLLLTLVLPIVSLVRMARAERALAQLEQRVATIEHAWRAAYAAAQAPKGPAEAGARSEVDAPVAPPAMPDEGERHTPDAGPNDGESGSSSASATWDPASAGPERTRPASAAPATSARAATTSLEERIGGRWLLYIGIAALVLGASYFVKYAFENEWVTPSMRVVLGIAAGIALVVTGERLARRGLALFGPVLDAGGLSVVVVALFAAYRWYDLLGTTTAFAGFVVVTVTTTLLAEKHRSQPLAMMAVACGFVTPFLLSTGRDAQLALFAYDAVLVAGTLVLARRHEWPLLDLLAFAGAVVTWLAWGAEYYTASKWLRTELLLTLFVALFAAALREARRLTSATARAVAAVLWLAPVLYHVASIAVLMSRPLAMVVYLIAANLAGVLAAGMLGAPWLRLITLVAVGLPAAGWIDEHAARSAAWLLPGAVALASMYGIHLLAQVRAVADTRPRLAAAEVVAVHATGAWLLVLGSELLHERAIASFGGVALALALLNFGIAAAFRRTHLEAALHYMALAFAMLVVAVGAELDGPWATAAWAAEGAALVWIGLQVPRDWLRSGGLGLLLVAGVRAAEELARPAPADAMVFFNVRTAATLFIIALLALAAWLHVRHGRRSRSERFVFDALVVGANLLAVGWMSAEIVALFEGVAWAGTPAGAGSVTAAELGTQVSLSTCWAAYAVGLVAAGIWTRYRPVRVLAICLLATTVVKVFAVDLARLDRIYRILSVLALGVLLLVASYLYQRFTARVDEPPPAEPDAHPPTNA